MCDISTLSYTVIKRHDDGPEAEKFNENNYQWTIKRTPVDTNHERTTVIIKDLTLQQEPKETLDMRCSFLEQLNTYYYTTGEKSTDYFYDLELKFDNYIHEFSQDYCYEILCKISSEDNKRYDYLFHKTERRFFNNIRFRGKCTLKMGDLDNIQFYVRRFNSQQIVTNGIQPKSVFKSLVDNVHRMVTLNVGDKQIPVLESVLAQKSEVFKVMFTHEMKEKKSGAVTIYGADVPVVEKMIEFAYTGHLSEISASMAIDLFQVAERYQMYDLRRLCQEYFIFNVNINNASVLDTIQLASLYNIKALKTNAIKFIETHEIEMVRLKRYRDYLCHNVCMENLVSTLLLSVSLDLEEVRSSALTFLKENIKDLTASEDFMYMFNSHPDLMKLIFAHLVTGVEPTSTEWQAFATKSTVH